MLLMNKLIPPAECSNKREGAEDLDKLVGKEVTVISSVHGGKIESIAKG